MAWTSSAPARGQADHLSTAGSSFVKNPMKFSPLDDRVVMHRLNAEEKTADGIIIPDHRGVIRPQH